MIEVRYKVQYYIEYVGERAPDGSLLLGGQPQKVKRPYKTLQYRYYDTTKNKWSPWFNVEEYVVSKPMDLTDSADDVIPNNDMGC